MLILTRRPGQRIIIGEDIFIDITSVKGQDVKVGIIAPKHVPIDREEVRERKIKFPYPDDNHDDYDDYDDSADNDAYAAEAEPVKKDKTPKISFKGKLKKKLSDRHDEILKEYGFEPVSDERREDALFSASLLLRED